MQFQIVGFILLGLYYGFWLLDLLSMYMRGRHPIVWNSGQPGRKGMIELAMTTILFFTTAAQCISVGLDIRTDWEPIAWIGMAVSICGVLLLWITMFTLQDEWKTGVNEKKRPVLVTDGVYAWSRNPAFLAYVVFSAGITLMFFSWSLLVMTLVSCLVLDLQIRLVEEPYLQKKAGREYAHYCRRVHRYAGRKLH